MPLITMYGYKVHPVTQKFPRLAGAELEAFEKDILANGLLSPIATKDGVVIDGLNRLGVCYKYGLTPRFQELPPEADPVEHMMSANLHRRHLNESQRSILGAQLLEYLAVEAKERQVEGGKTAGRGRPKREKVPQNSAEPIHSNESRDKAAELVNVSHYSIDRARKVLGEGVPELVAMVEKGDVAVSAAADVASLPKKEQEKVVAAGPKAVKSKAADIRVGKKGREAKPQSQGSAPTPSRAGKGFLFDDSISTVRRTLDKLQGFGKVPAKAFWKAVGTKAERQNFLEFLAEVPHLQLVEDGDTVELRNVHPEKELARMVRESLGNIRKLMGTQDRYKFDIDLLKKAVQDLYSVAVRIS